MATERIDVEAGGRVADRRGVRGVWEIWVLAGLGLAGLLLQTWPGTWPLPILGGLVIGWLMISGAVSSVAVREGRRAVVALVMTAILATTLSGALTGWPMRLRFMAGGSGFDAVVAQAGPPPPAASGLEWQDFPAPCPAMIGSYRIESCFAVNGGYLFFEANGGFLDQAGFAYLPGGPETLGSDAAFELQSIEHLTGDWYAFVHSW